jgi:hypothetical protein
MRSHDTRYAPVMPDLLPLPTVRRGSRGRCSDRDAAVKREALTHEERTELVPQQLRQKVREAEERIAAAMRACDRRWPRAHVAT